MTHLVNEELLAYATNAEVIFVESVFGHVQSGSTNQ
jgi:hypothetical protein